MRFELVESIPDEAQIVIEVDRSEYDRLKAFPVKENINDNGEIREIDLSIAEYQIFRLYDTLGENLHAGKRIKIIVIDENGNLINVPFIKN